MNDKELDDFFRNQSENPDISYREEDWEKLRKKLDASPPPPGINGSGNGGKSWWIGLSLALVIISGAGLGWKYWGDEVRDAAAKSEQLATTTALGNDRTASPNELQETDNTDYSTAEDSLSAKVAAPSADPRAQPTTGLTKPKEQPGDEEASPTSSSFGFDPSSSKSTVAKSLKRHQITPMKVNLHNIQPLSLDILTDDQKKQIQGNLPKYTGKQNQRSEAKSDKNTLKGSRFYTTLTLAPDVSALKIKDIQGLGNSVGFNLEYFIHPNISINAGAMYVFKTYQAGEAYSTGYVPSPSHVNGNCWVLDLPLNLRYYAFNQSLSRWYVTAGLSSYLMLKEKYDLEYTSYNYGGSAYGNSLEVQNKNRHYLNIVNLGIGYERVLTNRLSLQVEPYLKLPLNGIGEGDIILKSAGAFVGLKYGW